MHFQLRFVKATCRFGRGWPPWSGCPPQSDVLFAFPFFSRSGGSEPRAGRQGGCEQRPRGAGGSWTRTRTGISFQPSPGARSSRAGAQAEGVADANLNRFLIVGSAESSRTPRRCLDEKQMPAGSGVLKTLLLLPALFEAFVCQPGRIPALHPSPPGTGPAGGWRYLHVERWRGEKNPAGLLVLAAAPGIRAGGAELPTSLLTALWCAAAPP